MGPWVAAAPITVMGAVTAAVTPSRLLRQRQGVGECVAPTGRGPAMTGLDKARRDGPRVNGWALWNQPGPCGTSTGPADASRTPLDRAWPGRTGGKRPRCVCVGEQAATRPRPRTPHCACAHPLLSPLRMRGPLSGLPRMRSLLHCGGTPAPPTPRWERRSGAAARMRIASPPPHAGAVGAARATGACVEASRRPAGSKARSTGPDREGEPGTGPGTAPGPGPGPGRAGGAAASPRSASWPPLLRRRRRSRRAPAAPT